MPVSGLTLFRQDGVPVDLLEIALREEGWISPCETLLELLKNPGVYSRTKVAEIEQFCDFPDDWTDEDFMDYFSRRS